MQIQHQGMTDCVSTLRRFVRGVLESATVPVRGQDVRRSVMRRDLGCRLGCRLPACGLLLAVFGHVNSVVEDFTIILGCYPAWFGRWVT